MVEIFESFLFVKRTGTLVNGHRSLGEDFEKYIQCEFVTSFEANSIPNLNNKDIYKN